MAGLGIEDALFGKKEESTPTKQGGTLEAQNLGKFGLDSLLEQLEQDIPLERGLTGQQLEQEDLALQRSSVAEQSRQLVGSRDDQIRSIRDNLARQGVRGSSLGLGAESKARAGIDERIRQLRTGLRLRESDTGRATATRQFGRQQRDTRLGLSSLAAGFAPGVNPGIQGSGLRSGGLGDLALTAGGAVLGGYIGGPTGVAAGAKVGQGLGQSARAL